MYLKECGELAARGVKEVVLLGQTVNAYRHDEVDFGRLLTMVAAIEGIERIRFTSPHPCDMTPSVIEAMAAEPKVQPYLHLPVQSGSDRMLAAMERGYSVGEYLELVERLRRAIPGLALSTDIIVGFHGEEEDDFAATMALMREVGFDCGLHLQVFRAREYPRLQAGRHGERGRKGAPFVGGDRASGIALDGSQPGGDRSGASKSWSKDRPAVAAECCAARRPISRPRCLPAIAASAIGLRCGSCRPPATH